MEIHMDLRVQQRPLIEYNLQRNPFPNVGVPDEPVSIYTDRVEELQVIGDAIKGTLRGSSSHVVIVGSYGNGKTTSLKFVKWQIEQRLPNALALYISNPGETFLEFYRNFMYEFGLERLQYSVWSYLEFVSRTQGLKNKVEQGEVLISEVLEIGKKRLYNDLRYTDFATAFLELILDETRFLSWKYLCGEPILFEQRRELDVVTLIDSDEKALRAFMSLKSILQSTGYEMVCLLVDELECIELLHPFKKQRILNSIRRLIDLNPSGLCLVMACAPEAWSSMIRDYHAFSERIFREVVLKPLNIDVVRDFVMAYLNRSRINDNDGNDGIYPFTEDAIREILIAAQGNIRRVLMICNRAIDLGCDMNFPLLSMEKLKEILPEIFQTSA